MTTRAEDTRRLGRFERFVTSLSKWLEWIGLTALACMVLVAVIDTIGAKVFKQPFPGSTEVTALLQLIAISGGLAYSTIDGKQIYVGFLVDAVKGRVKTALQLFCSLLPLGFFALAAWMIFDYAVALQARGTETFLLGVPLYPFAFWLAVACCISMCLIFILNMIRSLIGRAEKGGDVA